MKFYCTPTFPKNSFYFSLWTSISFFFVATYFFFQKKYPSLLFLALLYTVSIVSIFHHVRSYDETFNDVVRWIDIVFANCFGFYLLFFFNKEPNLFWIFSTCYFFMFTQFAKDTKTKSFFHSLSHSSVLVWLVLYLHDNR